MTRPASPRATPRKPRARSQVRIDSILDAARTLLAAEGVSSLSIYSVAQRAAIAPSSVYHFFPSVPALLQALTSDVHGAFRACLKQPVAHDELNGWRDLSRIIEQRMLTNLPPGCGRPAADSGPARAHRSDPGRQSARP